MMIRSLIAGFGLTLALVAGLPTQTVSAQAPGPYRTMGAPPAPAVPAQWNRYHDYAQATEILQQLVAAHPQWARLESLGKSFGGREMWVLAIGDLAAGDEATKSAFWIDGGIHANEIQATEVVLYTAWYLLESRADNEFIQRLLAKRFFYLCPMLSPDSRDAHFYEPNTTHSPRSGQRPVDDDRDGMFDEDGPDDLDGDGSIVQMRVRDPRGRFKPHPDYPDLLIEADVDEAGEYALLGEEGVDNDGDGLVNEDGDGYYDPNRNWGWKWQPEYVQRGAHRYPFSIAENRVVADFIAAHRNIAGAQSYHNAGGMILRGPGTRDDAFPAEDIAVYDQLGRRGEQILPGYKYMNVAEELYTVCGGSIDWFHQAQGVFTFTNELFTGFNLFRRPSGGFFGTSEDQHAFNRDLLFGQGFVSWHEVDHPQLGRVEVGGFRKEWIRQPPSFLLEEECHRNMAFTLFHADQMPRIELGDVSVRELGDGLLEVTVAVSNDRLTPTHSVADLSNRITPPDRVSLTAPQLTVHAALLSSDRYFRQPQSQEQEPQVVRISRLSARETIYVRWLVSGVGPFQVTAESVKGGQDSAVSP